MRPTVKLLNNVAYVHTDRINHTSIFRERQLLRTHKENMLLEKRLWDIKPFIRSDDWARLTINLIIHSFIQEFIMRPFKKSTQRRPSPATAIHISLKQPAKRTFIIFRQDTDFQGESIPGGGGQQWR